MTRRHVDRYADDHTSVDVYGDSREGRGPRAGHRSRRRPRRRLRRFLFGCLFAFLGIAILGIAAFVIGYARTSIPDPNAMLDSNTTTIYYRDGRNVLGSYHAQNRISVPLDQVPKNTQDAVVAAENRSFWTDRGVSPTGIVRAAWNTARGQNVQGGSTITQQYVKNYYLSQEQTWTRKVKELFITLKVQRQLSKQEILQNYLNTSYFGRGAWGIETASQAYFGKHVQELTPQESAVLASLLRAPSIYDPAVDPTNRPRLEARYHYVLGGMAKLGHLSAAQVAQEPLPKIKRLSKTTNNGGPGGYLVSQVRKELVRLGYSEAQIETGGLQVTTTVDAKAQRAMQDAFAKNFPTKNAKGVYAGGAAVRPGTGEVVAMYGGKDYIKRQFNDATQAKLQPGSTFKSFALAAALEDRVSLRSRFAGNSPFELDNGDEVRNEFNRDYGRYVDLMQATRDSINTAYVDLTVNRIGPDAVYDAAVRAGVPENSPGLDKHAKIALGFASVSPMDMANSYATFAAEGRRAPWHLVEKVTAPGGNVLHETKVQDKREFSKPVVRDLDYALQDVVKHGSAEEAAQNLGRPAAGKTGTHEDQTAWFVGYTPQLAASVAFYKDANGDGKKESLDNVGGMNTFFGGGYPARIWAQFMKEALAGQPVRQFPPPANLGKVVNPKPTFTRRPKPTFTPTPTPTPTPTATPTPTPTDTPTPTPTFTRKPPGPRPKPTNTLPIPTPTSSPSPTRTKGPHRPFP
ncbi:transglycosylase domain-containing protein [Actinopolymorpha sp. NPDC004070]|uniref:transglycosylase domain-containing protein n=1 Tax=Actinopolymorpha sp. NPDC004070 TaxID=3154548 RepID=UPI0033A98FA9